METGRHGSAYRLPAKQVPLPESGVTFLTAPLPVRIAIRRRAPSRRGTHSDDPSPPFASVQLMSSAARRSSLHSLSSSHHEPSSSPDQPAHSILLNGGLGSPPSHPHSPTVSELGSTRIHFAPLPQVPPELKRRSSIALGVAARKNLLSNQQAGNHRVLTMNDADWQEYKKQYEVSNG